MMITKSNRLIHARYPDMKLNEMKIYNLAIAKSQRGEHFFMKKELEDLTGEYFSNSELNNYIERLRDMTFSIEKCSNSSLIFEEIRFDNGTVSFKWSKQIKPHICL